MKLNEVIQKLFHKNKEFQMYEINGVITLGAKIDTLQFHDNVNVLAIDFHNIVEENSARISQSLYENYRPEVKVKMSEIDERDWDDVVDEQMEVFKMMEESEKRIAEWDCERQTTLDEWIKKR